MEHWKSLWYHVHMPGGGVILWKRKESWSAWYFDSINSLVYVQIFMATYFISWIISEYGPLLHDLIVYSYMFFFGGYGRHWESIRILLSRWSCSKAAIVFSVRCFCVETQLAGLFICLHSVWPHYVIHWTYMYMYIKCLHVCAVRKILVSCKQWSKQMHDSGTITFRKVSSRHCKSWELKIPFFFLPVI